MLEGGAGPMRILQCLLSKVAGTKFSVFVELSGLYVAAWLQIPLVELPT